MKTRARTWLDTYGMVLVLVALCVWFALATITKQSGGGAGDGAATAALAQGPRVLVAAGNTPDDLEFTAAADSALRERGLTLAGTVNGDPPAVRAAVERIAAQDSSRLEVVTTSAAAAWPLWASLRAQQPSLGDLQVLTAPARRQSLFLARSNLRNIADQIAVIAIMAVAMTAVIITGGIDLSVGSLLALAAVAMSWLVARWGGAQASSGVVLGAALCAVAACALVGAFSGLMVTAFNIPPFVVTLATMQVASGLAFIIARGQSIYDLPSHITWLGRGVDPLLGLPNAVWLMLVCYAVAHVFMTRTVAGRSIYAVGGNPEAARLSGLRTQRLIMLVYTLSGAAAGLGGVVTVSQLRAGAPTYGVSYELLVIAAVVVGGTSLSGGQGSVLGTLIGAFIIAVIRNGMNLMGIEPYTQKVVLGAVILLAVLVDQLKRRVRFGGGGA